MLKNENFPMQGAFIVCEEVGNLSKAAGNLNFDRDKIIKESKCLRI